MTIFQSIGFGCTGSGHFSGKQLGGGSPHPAEIIGFPVSWACKTTASH
ncbi:hypothetical protein OOT46_03990 [Aquabacterium sp. A7-Y]|nr:hypothetical protein [Aquabacterium sp. A7-Y]MCW7537014.1 hypothetical protein [Aquabacterium sp. A7-Y]